MEDKKRKSKPIFAFFQKQIKENENQSCQVNVSKFIKQNNYH